MFELIAAPYTPLDESGELNLDGVGPLAAHLRGAGVDGVLVAGSTGEGPSLTGPERRRLAERWVEVAGGLRVIAHVGHPSVREARDLARHAAESGADAICAAPPSWFPIRSEETLVETCAAIASSAPERPFFYYHVPVLSGVHVSMARWLDLARDRIPNLGGVKYTDRDPLDFQACIRGHGDNVRLLWGCDELLLVGLVLGAHGAVGSSYNFAAPLYRRLVEAHETGDGERARGLQSRAALLVETLGRRGYPAASKAVMKLLGVDCGPVRAPLEGLGNGEETALRADLEAIGFFDWVREPQSS